MTYIDFAVAVATPTGKKRIEKNFGLALMEEGM